MTVSTGSPKRIYSDGYGNSTRLRVDDAETEFYDGRDIRAFYEWSVPLTTDIDVNERQLFRVVTSVNTVIINAEYTIDNGQIRVTSFAGGTPTGAFSIPITTLKSNGMSTAPAHTIQTVVTATAPGLVGAVNITGGAQLNAVRLKTSVGSGAAITVGNQPDSKLGLAPGTYYILVENIGAGTIEGTIRLRWWESAV